MNRKFIYIVIVVFFSLLLSSCKNDAKKEIDDRNTYLEKNNIDIAPTASGLYYIETKEGTGEQAKAGETVKVNYSGYLLDLTKFDSSFDRNEPLEFQLGVGMVISGWDEGIALMKEGGKATLIIPSNLAYGTRGTYTIPPYSTLVFDVELIEITD